MTRPPDLDQLCVFLSVVEEGSFCAAARALGRAKSAVTYAIQELEADLQVDLFDRSAHRPALSAAGRALLPRAKRVLYEAGALRLQAAGIAQGLEPEVTVVVDPHYPMGELTAALLEFEERVPSVTTRLYVEALGTPVEMVVGGAADLCLATVSFAGSEHVEHRHAGWLDLAPVRAGARPGAGPGPDRSAAVGGRRRRPPAVGADRQVRPAAEPRPRCVGNQDVAAGRPGRQASYARRGGWVG